MKRNIKSAGQGVIQAVLEVLYGLIRRKKENAGEILSTEMCKLINRYEDNEMVYRIRPENPASIPNITYDLNCKLAIIMQGPLRCEDHFTVRSVEYYRKMYPNAVIIVSTWIDECASEIDSLKKAGAIVLQNHKPEYAGHLNLNYQLYSTYMGLKKAENLGIEFACKTRTDQRISKAHALEYIINLINTFPSKNNKQKSRIATISINYGNMFFPYFLSDFFYLGRIEDMKIMFDGSLDTRDKVVMARNSSRRDYAKKLYPPEIYIMKNYLDAIGYKCDYTIKNYWMALKDSLICLDMKMIDLVWPKYENKYKEHIFYGDYFYDDSTEKMKTMNFDFINWFNLYSGTLKYLPDYEKLADVIFK